MRMSSPPTYEQSQTSEQKFREGAPSTSTSQVPIATQDNNCPVDTISTHVVRTSQSRGSVSLSLSAHSLSHSRQPSIRSESQSQGQSQSRSRPLKKPWFLWAIAVIDIVLGAYFGTTMLYTKAEKTTEIDPVFGGKPMMTEFVFLLVSLRNLVQFLMGVALICGLLSSKESTTIFCLQGWIQGAYFIICEQCFSLCSNITKLSAIEVDEATAWRKVSTVVGNSFDILLRALTFFLVRNYLTNLKIAHLYGSRRTQVRYALPHQHQHQTPEQTSF